MKTTFAIFVLICATAAFAQTSAPVLQNNPQPLQMFEHAEHATQHELAQPQNILEHSDYTYARGERPLSDFGSPSEPQPPLGDIARAYRLAHAAAPKAAYVFEKYVASK